MEREKTFMINLWQKTKLITNIVLSVLIILAVVRICYVPFIRYHNLFTWHVVLGAVAYLLLMPASLLIFDNSWFIQYTRHHKSWIHRILVVVASVLGIVCVGLDIYRKEIYKVTFPEIIHFESAHSITGLISAILLIFANVTGLSTVYSTWFRNKIANIPPVVQKLVHNIVGQLSYIIGVISICLVFYDPWFTYYTTVATRISLTIVIALMTFWSLINSFLSECNQIRTILE